MSNEYNEIHTLAKNKLIILYFLNKISIPISTQQLDEFILSTMYMNFFEYQQYLKELEAQKLIHRYDDELRTYIEISQSGKDVLNTLINLLPQIVLYDIEDYIKKNYRKIKINTEVYSDYKIVSPNEYIVVCSLREGNSLLFEVKVNVPHVEIAKRICRNWNKNAEVVYRLLFENLAKNHEESSQE
ncbi:DUF4364 family protein [Caldicellulosiruptor morganii]|uniref:DUF4364 family protein n=1 Tax=Caldicellulosiruptor morganii TaxID=1387555 RepID=A0ABY7BQG0_9FIRM|nr:DUF4364 family protein [Caldicellulosiruptor morganii]WAM33256.1 DUF4364 family protein [Caldicellulosiruptor morganii]